MTLTTVLRGLETKMYLKSVFSVTEVNSNVLQYVIIMCIERVCFTFNHFTCCLSVWLQHKYYRQAGFMVLVMSTV